MKSPNDYVVDLIKVVSARIGHRLTTIKQSGSTVPAVFPLRSKAPRNNFPFIVIDHLNIFSEGEQVLNSYLEDGTKFVEEFAGNYTFLIQVESNQEGNALGIAQELNKRLRGSLGKQAISDTLGGELKSMSEVSFASNLMTNDFSEKARFTLNISVIDCIIDENPYTIETVSVEGDLTQPDSTISKINVDVPN
jgi:hypothetical protein